MREREDWKMKAIRGAVGRSWSEDGAFRFRDADARGVDFSGRHFSAWSAEQSTFEECSFDAVTFVYAKWGAGRRSTEPAHFAVPIYAVSNRAVRRLRV